MYTHIHTCSFYTKQAHEPLTKSSELVDNLWPNSAPGNRIRDTSYYVWCRHYLGDFRLCEHKSRRRAYRANMCINFYYIMV